VGVFPKRDAVLRLVAAVLMEIFREWQVRRRYFNQESMKKPLEPNALLLAEPEPLRLTHVC
jgi:hypothetical protein